MNYKLIHFPQTPLSGYGRLDFTSLSTDSWHLLEENKREIVSLAEKLGLWVVLGSCRKVANKENPANCIHVISDKGRIAGNYDKQKLTLGSVDITI